jgi:hypothetical protein
MVRSRQIAQKLSFWLTLIGYNPRDHSLSHRIYLVYASIFMSLWGFAMLSLAAGAAATALTLPGTGSANQAAAQVSLFILVIWLLYQLWQVSRRSPFMFSEEDAYLICQTPVRRSFVALSWFLGDWFPQALPFWALGVTFGFAMVESQLGGKVAFSDLFQYIASGLRALGVFIPLQLGLLALLWALGALRLQGDREWRWMSRLTLIMILVVIGSLTLGIIKPEFAALVAPVGGAILWPLRYPLQAAFSLHAWISGVVLASGIALVGLVALAIAGEGLNLSRAAQESTQREKLQSAQRYGMVDLAREMKQRDRLGIGRSPARLPARPGLWVLPWKDILQSRYGTGFGEIRNWLVLLGISFGLLLAPDFGSRLFLLAFWIFALGQRTTFRLRADLGNWWMLRSLPFSAERLILTELAIPWSLTVGIGWLGIIFGGAGLGAFRLTAALLMSPVCMMLSLVAAYDILRQSRAEMLLNGNVPGISALTIVGGAVCLFLPAGMIFLLNQLPGIGAFLAFAVSLLLAYGLWRMAAKKYRSISYVSQRTLP